MRMASVEKHRTRFGGQAAPATLSCAEGASSDNSGYKDLHGGRRLSSIARRPSTIDHRRAIRLHDPS